MGEIKNGCDGMEDRIILYVDRELAPGERLEVENHLKSCASCRKIFESYAKIDRAASSVFVSERRLPAVKLEKSPSAGFFEQMRYLFGASRFALHAAAVAACVLAAVALYHSHIATESPSAPSFGRFTCREFRVGSEPAAIVNYHGAGEIAEGSTIAAAEPGAFSSERYDVAFRRGARAKLGSTEIALAEGTIDINYFSKPAPAGFAITTPNARILIRGTKLRVSYLNSATEVFVTEGLVAVAKKSAELILGAGEGAVVKIDGEAEFVPAKQKSDGPKVFPQGPPDDTVPAGFRAPETAESGVNAAGVHDGGTAPAAIEKKPGEKILDYEVDLESMDERTRNLFFRNKTR